MLAYFNDCLWNFDLAIAKPTLTENFKFSLIKFFQLMKELYLKKE